MVNQYIIWGSKGHAKVLADTLMLLGNRVSAIFDMNPQATSAISGVPIFYGFQGFEKWKQQATSSLAQYFGLVAIGGARGNDRLQIQQFLESQEIALPALVHPTASVATSSRVLPGAQILAGAIVSSDCTIGRVCIINNRGGVDHDCIIGDGCHIAPGATLCGEIELKQNVMIGAGSVVTKSLPANVVAFGNPAKVIRKTVN